jgi:SAM-dependent methyltransferase
MSKEVSSPQELMDLVNAFRSSRIILSSVELGIYKALSGAELPSEAVSANLGTDSRATDRFMNALAAMGLLRKKEGRFSNTGFSEKFLVRGKPSFMGQLDHSIHLWGTWSTLTEAVFAGRSVAVTEPIGERDEEWLEGFIAAMHARGIPQAVEVADVLDLTNARRILDVGGGSGAFSFEFLRRNPSAHAVVFDLPSVIPITRNYILDSGMKDRISTQSGDYHADEFEGKFDLVYVSAVIHINSPEENMLLVQKSADALNRGGQLVIMDHIMKEDRTEPFAGAVFAINMLVGTEHGDTYTENEIRSWMEEAGLKEIIRIDTVGGTNLMVGNK